MKVMGNHWLIQGNDKVTFTFSIHHPGDRWKMYMNMAGLEAETETLSRRIVQVRD